MSEFVTEYGQQWRACTPRDSIKAYLGRKHASSNIDNLCRYIKGKCKGPGYTQEIIDETLRYARVVHATNLELYRRVMGGF
jgi:hypothetical protein